MGDKKKDLRNEFRNFARGLGVDMGSNYLIPLINGYSEYSRLPKKIIKIMKKVLLLAVFVVSLSMTSYSQSVERFSFDYISIFREGEKEEAKKYKHVVELRENSISFVSSRGSIRLNVLEGSGEEHYIEGKWFYALMTHLEGNRDKIVVVFLGDEEVIIEEDGVILVFYN